MWAGAWRAVGGGRERERRVSIDLCGPCTSISVKENTGAFRKSFAEK